MPHVHVQFSMQVTVDTMLLLWSSWWIRRWFIDEYQATPVSQSHRSSTYDSLWIMFTRSVRKFWTTHDWVLHIVAAQWHSMVGRIMAGVPYTIPFPRSPWPWIGGFGRRKLRDLEFPCVHSYPFVRLFQAFLTKLAKDVKCFPDYDRPNHIVDNLDMKAI